MRGNLINTLYNIIKEDHDNSFPAQDIIEYWQKELGITDWIITTERISPEQVDYNEATDFIGIERNFPNKTGIIYHDRDLYEEAIIHELVHVQQPSWSEDEVNAEMDRLMIEKPFKQTIKEDWKDTSWEDDEIKITIGDIVDYIGNTVVDIPISYLKKVLKTQLDKVTKEEERIMKADLQYPIIVVKKDGNITYVLDGNHRLQKAIMTGEEYIKAKVLDMDNPDVPQAFTRLL